jgi:hypothetical protein
MSRRLSTLAVLFCFITFGSTAEVTAQRPKSTLQVGIPLERTIASGQTHQYGITLQRDQYVQVVVDQRGIDVVVRVFSPEGKSLGEFDSPNGADGPENVSFVAASDGVYGIAVTPLDQFESTSPGSYEIKILELRRATSEELKAGKNLQAVKSKGVALLTEVVDAIPEIRSSQTRVRVQLRTSNLLWSFDEKKASKLAADAMAELRAYLATIDVDDQEYHQKWQWARQLRFEFVQMLAPHDPDLALSFLRSTRLLKNPDGNEEDEAQQESQFELSLADQIAQKDPKRAFQIAEDNLKRRFSSGLGQTVLRLRATDPALGVQLASDIAAKLQNEKLLRNPWATEAALSLLRDGRTQSRRQSENGQSVALLTEPEYQSLFQKTLSEVLSYSAPTGNYYSSERSSVQNILNTIQSMGAQIEPYLPGGLAAIEKKATELNASIDPQSAVWQQYQNTINNAPTDSAMEAVGQAPREIRDRLYHQLADKLAGAGDIALARQLITDHISNTFQRRQALNGLEQQAIYRALRKGRIEEALRSIGNLRSPKERAGMLSQIANQIGSGQKRATALIFLELARGMLGTSLHAENQEQMNALLQIAGAFSRYDYNRAFEIVEPLVDQFNEVSESARTVNGFGQEYFQDGELIMLNGNGVANFASQLLSALGTLGLADFDRAKTTSDRIHIPEVRLGAYLELAQQAIQK